MDLLDRKGLGFGYGGYIAQIRVRSNAFKPETLWIPQGENRYARSVLMLVFFEFGWGMTNPSIKYGQWIETYFIEEII
jgi:hypothetical protein